MLLKQLFAMIIVFGAVDNLWAEVNSEEGVQRCIRTLSSPGQELSTQVRSEKTGMLSENMQSLSTAVEQISAMIKGASPEWAERLLSRVSEINDTTKKIVQTAIEFNQRFQRQAAGLSDVRVNQLVADMAVEVSEFEKISLKQQESFLRSLRVALSKLYLMSIPRGAEESENRLRVCFSKVQCAQQEMYKSLVDLGVLNEQVSQYLEVITTGIDNITAVESAMEKEFQLLMQNQSDNKTTLENFNIVHTTLRTALERARTTANREKSRLVDIQDTIRQERTAFSANMSLLDKAMDKARIDLERMQSDALLADHTALVVTIDNLIKRLLGLDFAPPSTASVLSPVNSPSEGKQVVPVSWDPSQIESFHILDNGLMVIMEKPTSENGHGGVRIIKSQRNEVSLPSVRDGEAKDLARRMTDANSKVISEEKVAKIRENIESLRYLIERHYRRDEIQTSALDLDFPSGSVDTRIDNELVRFWSQSSRTWNEVFLKNEAISNFLVPKQRIGKDTFLDRGIQRLNEDLKNAGVGWFGRIPLKKKRWDKDRSFEAKLGGQPADMLFIFWSCLYNLKPRQALSEDSMQNILKTVMELYKKAPDFSIKQITLAVVLKRLSTFTDAETWQKVTRSMEFNVSQPQ